MKFVHFVGMAAKNESLILTEQAESELAPFLFPENELPRIDKTRPKFHCTGERLWRDRPDVYKEIVRLLAEPGVTIRTICNQCHVTDNLVRSVKARENLSIAHEKKTVLANIIHGLRLASERVIEVIPTASPKDSIIAVGVLAEKMQLLAGDVTARIEVGPVNVIERFQQLHERIARMKKANAHIVEDNDVERITKPPIVEPSALDGPRKISLIPE